MSGNGWKIVSSLSVEAPPLPRVPPGKSNHSRSLSSALASSKGSKDTMDRRTPVSPS
jgi:hypothetical protein